MGAVKSVLGAITVIGSGVIELESVGSLSGPMAGTAAFGANTAGGGVCDIWNSTFGDYEKVGNVNPMKWLVDKGLDITSEYSSMDDGTVEVIQNSADAIIDVGDVVAGAYGSYEGTITVFTNSDKYLKMSTNLVGKVMTKTPKPTTLAKSVAVADIANNVKSIWEDIKTNVDKYIGGLTQ